jgi:hypothetical protein
MMRLDLQRLGAVCAVLYAPLVVVSIAAIGGTGQLSANGAVEFLPILDANKSLAAAASILFIVMPLLLAVAGMALFLMLDRRESIAWLVVFGFVGGGLSILYRGFIWLAMTLELAPAYVHADASQQTSLAAVGNTLQVFSFGADMVGAVLVAGIGVLICSVLMLRQGIGPRWLGWLGIAAALVGGWLTLLTKNSEVAAAISGIGDLAWVLWIAAAGVIAWRTAPPPVAQAPDRAQPQHNPQAAIG